MARPGRYHAAENPPCLRTAFATPTQESIAVMRRVFASVLLAALFAVFAVAGSGCAKRHHISIESNSCWIATIDHQKSAVIHDCGSINYRVAGDIHCVAVTNLADTGFVRIRIDEGAWVESRVPLGTAETCR